MDNNQYPVVHFEIGCPNTEEASAFYQKTFNWDFTKAQHSTKINTQSTEGIQGHMTTLGHEPHNYVNLYISVDDINATLEAIVANGGQKHIGPIPLPDGHQFAWFKDVAGNMLGLITKNPMTT